MGRFVGTANVVYCLSFADQEKQTSHLPFPFAANKGSLPFLFSVFIKQTEVAVSVSTIYRLQNSRDVETRRHGGKEPWRHGDINRKTVPYLSQRMFFNPFTVFSSCKRKFVVCPFVDEETNRSYPFANRLHGLKGPSRLNGLACLCFGPTSVFTGHYLNISGEQSYS